MIVVTGATGFIGRRAAERLLASGRPVRCPVRSPERARDLADRGAEVVRCDLVSGTGLADAVRGADAVLHAAGVVRAWSRAAYFDANARGTGSLAAESARAGARAFLLVSSLAAQGPAAAGRPASEDDPPRPVNAYGASKLAAERELAAAAGAMRWAVVRPCAVYGPGDRDFLALFRLAARSRIVPYAAVPGAELSLVHVEDLVDLLLAALDRAPGGRTYLAAADPPRTWADAIRAIGRAVGRDARPVRIPPRLLWPLAAAAALAMRPFAPRPPLLSPGKVREAVERSWAASSARAQRELGWEPRIGLEEGAASTAAWYRERGWL
jgi:dihydroflavonol-4-reductase